MNPPQTTVPELSHPALNERAEATRAWLEMFGDTALDPHGDLLTAVTHEAQRRRWTVRLEIGSAAVSGDIELDPDGQMIGHNYADAAAAAAHIVMDLARTERAVGMPLYPRRGPPLSFGAPLPPSAYSSKPGAAGVQAIFDRLARGYGFGACEETQGEDGGTLTYRKEAYTLELSARRVQDRKNFIYSGQLTRHFRDGRALRHALPVLENNEYANRVQNRQWRDSVELFFGDLKQAAYYVSLPDEDGWSYGRVAQLHRGKGTGYISNIRAERIFFGQDQLTDATWRPDVGSQVRFRCADVEQSQKNRITAYRALDISEVDLRVTLREFA